MPSSAQTACLVRVATLPWSVKVWCNEFKQDHECVANEVYPHPHRTSVTNENTSHVRELIEQYRRCTVLQISELVFSYGSVQSVIRKQLGFRKISARCVPKLLNDDKKVAFLSCFKLTLKKRRSVFA
ncbi:uncharacterized protein LOC118200066 [Stegodyphus dumicola]|uniref:uncharacterized protein LOC118200066 n=1 Tax=Stegodyphus dumicola TaxID=202533 RepID=UPI0015A9970A|nr:uncharacterized protein LOC118200066 [Stegodyphus dumicola]